MAVPKADLLDHHVVREWDLSRYINLGVLLLANAELAFCVVTKCVDRTRVRQKA